jgi:hypothetical protein
MDVESLGFPGFYKVKRMVKRPLRYLLRVSLLVTMQGCGTVVKKTNGRASDSVKTHNSSTTLHYYNLKVSDKRN